MIKDKATPEKQTNFSKREGRLAPLMIHENALTESMKGKTGQIVCFLGLLCRETRRRFVVHEALQESRINLKSSSISK
jgi:hypothetical protein